jgi:hypothetical protein
MRLCEEVVRAPGVKALEVPIWEASREALPRYFVI